MTTHPRSRRTATLVAIALAALGTHARADEHGHAARMPLKPLYVQECGSCHVPYPPRMLPTDSWARLMKGLDRHFGTDASLDPADVQALSTWLANEGRRTTGGVPPPEDRISRTTWFAHEHGHIEPSTWRLPSVRTPSNCQACHSTADQGQFGERSLRMPEALSARQRAAWDD